LPGDRAASSASQSLDQHIAPTRLSVGFGNHRFKKTHPEQGLDKRTRALAIRFHANAPVSARFPQGCDELVLRKTEEEPANQDAVVEIPVEQPSHIIGRVCWLDGKRLELVDDPAGGLVLPLDRKGPEAGDDVV